MTLPAVFVGLCRYDAGHDLEDDGMDMHDFQGMGGIGGFGGVNMQDLFR